MSAYTIPSVFIAVDKFSGPMKVMGNAVQGFVSRSERLFTRANRAFSSLMTPLTNINRMLMGLGYYVGLFTLIRIIKNAIDIFADFEQANANLAAVMGTTVQANKALAMDARRVGLAYGVAATQVVEMQHALATLGFEQQDILKMGGPLITGSAALEGASPQLLAETVGAVIKTFDNLEAKDTQHILDVMTLAANKTALTFEKLATTLPIVSGPANALGITFEQQVALLGILANAGVHVATSATSLKNIFIDSKKKGLSYSQVLEVIAQKADKLTYAYNKFGKRSVVSALVLSNKLRETAALQKELENVAPNLTGAIALQRLDTFRGAQKLLNAAYQEFILSIEDGTGKYADNLKWLLKVSAATLLLASGSDQAREAISKMNPEIVKTAQKWLWWTKVIGWFIAALLAAKIVLIVWNTVLGIASIALSVWGGLIRVVTAAQWLWNAAMAANPIGLIIIAISALLIYVSLAVDAYKEWGAAGLLLMGPFGQIIGFFVQLQKHWEMIKEAFTSKGFLAGISQIGLALLDSFIVPLQQIIQLIASLTGAQWATNAATQLQRLHEQINAPEGQSKEGDKQVYYKINPKQKQNEAMAYQIQQSGHVRLDINDPGGHVGRVQSDTTFIQPSIKSSFGEWYKGQE